MSWQQADLDKVRAAIASGVKRVVYSDGRQVEYASLSDMMTAKDMIERELAATNAPAGQNSRARIVRLNRFGE